MGTKDSKPLVVAYEEAIKRVPEADLTRLRNAFKRFATGQGLLTKQVFIKEVLGDILPLPLAELIYTACGGQTKGIVLKDLLCGLVLLSLGTLEEKTRLLFNLYASDVTQITKDELVNLVGTYEGPNAAHRIAHCFQDVDRVSLDIFRDTVLANRDLTCLVTWLLEPPAGVSLSTEQDSPTFYQTLSGVTHLDESEIIELEKRYWQLKSYSLSGKFDLETFELMVTPPLGDEALASVLVRNLFFALDENCDGHVDFKEMACGVSAACRGPLAERLKFCFKMFDIDHDGFLNREETQVMLQTLVALQSEANKDLNYLDGLKQDLAEDAEDINLERFLVWGVASPLPIALLTLLFEICHVILGLNPRTRQEEEEVVLGWLKREEGRGLQLGQFWYLVAWDWWASWKQYTTYLNVEDSPILNNNASSVSLKSLIASPNLKTSPSSNSLTRSNKSSVSDGVVLTSLTLLNNEMEEIRLLPKLGNGTLSSSTGNELKMPPSKPGAIDNSILIIPTTNKVMILTGEGGRLRKVPPVTRNKDYHLFPEPLWKALVAWYGGSPALPRQVIANHDTGQLELELYPFVLKLLRHQSANQSFQPQPAGWSGLVGGYGAAALGGGYGYSPSTSLPPRRYLAYTAAFSRLANIRQMYEYLCSRLRLKAEDMRLWHVKDDTMNLLEDEEATLVGLGIDDQDQILIEIRNKDQTWPEEMVSLTVSGSDRTKTVVPTEKGATGLNNLGNTCFMNAALQCVSNTLPLTQYFLAHVHLKELNSIDTVCRMDRVAQVLLFSNLLWTNPLGMKGNIAKDYGELVQDIWRGTIRTVAPLRLRWTIGKYAPRFSGYAQHDAQELLAFLLDGLHEDLNRVQDKPYVELRDSENRPDDVVAQEAWENHLLRNRSIIVDLFHGQLKSKVTCQVCSQESVRFDPFNYLSLPLPVETLVHMEVVVVKSDGSTPVKYGLRLSLDSTYADLQKKLEGLCGVSAYRLLLAEVSGAQIKNFSSAESKLRATSGVPLFAYEALTTNSQEDQNLLMPNASLAQIQRVASTSPRVARTNKTTNGDVPNGEISQTNINWTQQISSSSDSSNRVCLEGENRGIRAKQEEEVRLTPRFCMTMTSMLCKKSTGIVKSQEAPETILSPGRTGREREPSAGSGHSLPDSLTSITSSSQGSQSPDSEAESSLGLSVNVLMAYHRKMIRQDVYFLSCHKTRPSLFGLPLLIPYLGDVTTGQELYKSVWTLVARLVSPLPPQDNSAIPNHAQDCDDSLGYEFPFVLSWVTSEGLQCSICPWNAFCRGCPIPCTPTPILDQRQRYVAIDWDPTALHLRYQASLERVFIQHESVSETSKAQTEPISLARCLDAFTHEEQLAGDEKWYCSNCKAHQPATKKLQIWRLPPVLIVHLKRFQFVNQRWVKSQKMVNFRLKDFDPTPFLASVPRETILRHRQMALGFDSQENSSWLDPSHGARGEGGKRNRVQSTSLANHPIVDEELRDFHQHKLQQGTNPFDITYRLYAAVCHSGMLGGGHYVAYAWNPNDKWYCYNDSSCKEVSPAMIEAQSAYMLFYEREGLDLANYLPQVSSNGTILHDNDHNISLTPSFALPTANDGPSTQTADVGNSDEQDRKNCVLM